MRCVAFLALYAIGACACLAEAGRNPFADPGLAAARAAQGAEAVKRFRALAEAYPQSKDIWFEFGAALYAERAYEEALAAFERAGALGEQPMLFLARKGKCLAKLKRHGEAEVAFRGALHAGAAVPAVKFGLAAALFQQQKSAEAQPLFEALAKLADEWGEVAKEYLALCYFDSGRYERAIELLSAQVAKNPQDERALDARQEPL